MRIDQIDLYHVAMPLIYPWRTAYGEDWTVESVLVRLTSGSLVAWGETTSLAAPCYSPEHAAGVFLTLQRWLAPAIVGQQIDRPEVLQQRLAHFKGNPFAKAGLDNAWWALRAVEEQRPLHQLLGATRDVVPVGADFGVRDSIDELLTLVGQAVDVGYPRIKLKFRPGWDLNVLQAVRAQHPKQAFHIDCNSGYRLDDFELFKQVDRFELAMIEQPLAHDDLHDHAKLQRLISTPICLDESITSLAKTRQAIELGSCQYVNIKPGRVGGLTNALAIHHECQKASIPCWVGGMIESAVGVGHCCSLAMLDNFIYPADIFPTAAFYADDLGEPRIELTRTAAGQPAIAAPVIAPTPHPDRLQRCCVAHAAIRRP